MGESGRGVATSALCAGGTGAGPSEALTGGIAAWLTAEGGAGVSVLVGRGEIPLSLLRWRRLALIARSDGAWRSGSESRAVESIRASGEVLKTVDMASQSGGRETDGSEHDAEGVVRFHRFGARARIRAVLASGFRPHYCA